MIQVGQHLAQTNTIAAPYSIFRSNDAFFWKDDPLQQLFSWYSQFLLEYLRIQRQILKIDCWEWDYEIQGVVAENPFYTSHNFSSFWDSVMSVMYFSFNCLNLLATSNMSRYNKNIISLRLIIPFYIQ